jgi:hypothetical protein
MYTLSLIISLAASALLLYMAVFVLFKNWRAILNRYLFYFLITVFGIISSMFLSYAFPDSPGLIYMNRITQFFTVLFFSSAFLMSLVFPLPGKRPSLAVMIISTIPALATGVIIMVTDYSITGARMVEGVIVREFGFFYNIYAGIALFYLLMATGNFIRKYVNTKVDVYRLQLKYVFLGSCTSAILAAVFALILPRFFHYSDLYILGPSVAVIIGASSMFYSVINHNLMDLSTVINRVPLIILQLILTFTPVYFILYFTESETALLPGIQSHIIAGSIAFAFIFFSISLVPRLDNIFKRKFYKLKKTLDDFVSEVRKFISPEYVIQRTVDVMFEAMQLKKVVFLVYNEDAKMYELAYYRVKKAGDLQSAPVERSSPVIRWFVRNHDMLYRDRIYIDDDMFDEVRDELTDYFEINGFKMIFPIYHEKRLFGMLCFGEKESMLSFTTDEMTRLKQFHLECNDFISTAFFAQKAKQEQFIGRTSDLSSYILSNSVPKYLPRVKGIKFGAFMIPRYEEGVDYFDFIRPGDIGIGVIATDVSGVGINSALYSVLLRSAFLSSVNDAPSTYTIMQKLNKLLHMYTGGKGGLVTSFYFFYDYKNMGLMYTNAGFPALEVFRVEKGDFDSLDTEGIPLGYDESANYGIGRTHLEKDDIGVLYSKSLLSSKNDDGQVYGLVRLRNMIRDNRTRRPHEITDIFNRDFLRFMGTAKPEADVFVLVFKIM